MEFQMSAATRDRVESAKSYIERKYAKALLIERQFKQNWQLLQLKMESLQMNIVEKQMIEREVMKQELQVNRKKRQKITTNDYEPLAIIGRGAFGEVRVCREKKTGQIVAIKKMKKSEMIQKNQLSHVRAERDILTNKENNWIVNLICSFQDQRYLYLVMEFLQGGDLMNLLIKKDIFTERESRFYASELILAIDSVHKMNYIHRDIKPDNILIGKDGHIKLSDFGLCKHSVIIYIQKKYLFFQKQKAEINLYYRQIFIRIFIVKTLWFFNNEKIRIIQSQHFLQQELQIIQHLKFLNNKDIQRQLIGGVWGLYYLKCFWDILLFIQNILNRLAKISLIGEKHLIFLMNLVFLIMPGTQFRNQYKIKKLDQVLMEFRKSKHILFFKEQIGKNQNNKKQFIFLKQMISLTFQISMIIKKKSHGQTQKIKKLDKKIDLLIKILSDILINKILKILKALFVKFLMISMSE
ncbi:protein kinase domain protein, partial [Ichthyophthirius multifiliis]